MSQTCKNHSEHQNPGFSRQTSSFHVGPAFLFIVVAYLFTCSAGVNCYVHLRIYTCMNVINVRVWPCLTTPRVQGSPPKNRVLHYVSLTPSASWSNKSCATHQHDELQDHRSVESVFPRGF